MWTQKSEIPRFRITAALHGDTLRIVSPVKARARIMVRDAFNGDVYTDKIDSLSTEYSLRMPYLDEIHTLVIKIGKMRYIETFTPRY